jgi:hypothetical protein
MRNDVTSSADIGDKITVRQCSTTPRVVVHIGPPIGGFDLWLATEQARLLWAALGLVVASDDVAPIEMEVEL